MKIKILIYLLSFVFLILLFQMFNTNKILNYQDAQLKMQADQIKALKQTLQQKQLQESQAQFFSLKEVPTAQGDEDLNGFQERLQKALKQFNKNQPSQLFEGVKPDGVMLLEKIHILNKNWLIAHFNNQKKSGDVLIQYTVLPNAFEFKPLTTVFD